MLASSRSRRRLAGPHSGLSPAPEWQLEGRPLLSTVYVAPWGSNANPGTFDQPFGTIRYAMGQATGDGDGLVWARGGEYRQFVDYAGVGGNDVNKLRVFAYPGETPVIKGSEVVTGWTQHAGTVWKKPGWDVNSQQVFVNEVPLQQVGWAGGSKGRSDALRYFAPVGSSLDDCLAMRGSFFYDQGDGTLYVNLPTGVDSPSGQVIEASVRPRTWVMGSNTHHVHVKGLEFRHSNTSLSSNGASVALREHSIIEDFSVTYMDHGGLTIGAYSVARNGSVSHNGGNGGGTSGDAKGFLYQNVQMNYNNDRQFDHTWNTAGTGKNHNPHSYAGMKILRDVSGVIEGCEFIGNRAPGLWFDYAYHGNPITIRDNVMADNVSNGIFIEVTNNVDIYNNLIYGNRGRGIYLSAASDTRVFNNVIAYNGTGGQGQGQAAVDVSGSHRPVDEVATTWKWGYRLRGSDVVRSRLMLSKGNQVFNNIFYNNKTLRDFQVWRNPGAHPSELAFDNAADNNIYWRDGSNPIFQNLREFRDLNPDGSAKANSGNQTLQGLAAWQAARPELDRHSIQADPLFVDPANRDFRLRPGSPAIDAGADAPFVATDYGGAARPIGGGWDIGAFEYGVRATVGAEADAYVRGGSYAGDNYGDEGELLVKEAGLASFRREAFLRFDVGRQAPVEVASAKLRLFVTAGPDGVANRISVVGDDSWGESSLTWDTRPPSGAPFASWTPTAGGWVEIDVTGPVRDALAGGGKLSLKIAAVASNPANTRYASREHPDRSLRPQLVIQPVIRAEADSHVRSGSFAGDNYGSEAELLVKRGTSGFERQSFIRFDLSLQPTAAVATARLRLYATAGPSIPNRISVVGDDSWGESSLTWDTRPPSGAPFASWTPTAGGWVEIDVTGPVRDALAGGGRLSLKIEAEQTDATINRYASREHADISLRPQLILVT